MAAKHLVQPPTFIYASFSWLLLPIYPYFPPIYILSFVRSLSESKTFPPPSTPAHTHTHTYLQSLSLSFSLSLSLSSHTHSLPAFLLLPSSFVHLLPTIILSPERIYFSIVLGSNCACETAALNDFRVRFVVMDPCFLSALLHGSQTSHVLELTTYWIFFFFFFSPRHIRRKHLLLLPHGPSTLHDSSPSNRSSVTGTSRHIPPPSLPGPFPCTTSFFRPFFFRNPTGSLQNCFRTTGEFFKMMRNPSPSVVNIRALTFETVARFRQWFKTCNFV